jgi:hypothetical protein
MAKKKTAGISEARIQKHFERLQKLAAKHDGVLPSYTWLDKHGYFVSYDIVRVAGLLKKFKRASKRDQ